MRLPRPNSSNKVAPSAPATSPLKPDDSAILALDIGTEFVKAIIARENPKSGELEIIGVGRSRQASSNMFDGAIADIPGVVSVCERALTAAESMAGLTAKTTVVGIAGELIKGNTSTIRYRRKNGNKPLSEQGCTAEVETQCLPSWGLGGQAWLGHTFPG